MATAEIEIQTKAVQKITEESRKCFEFFFSQKYKFGSKEFDEQLWSLTRMAYISFVHLRGELEETARKMDVEDLLPDRQKPVTPQRTVSDSFSDDPETSVSTTEGAQDPGVTRETDSSYFLGESDCDVSFNTTSEDSVSSDITEQQQDTSAITVTETSSTMLSGDSDSFSDDSETSVSTEEGAQAIRTDMEMDPFIKKTLRGIKKVAPNLRYKPKHLRRKKFKVIPYEFASIWRNTPTIFSEVEPSPMESLLPSVSWEKVNPGALKRLPVPTKFPVHSVSQDLGFYITKKCVCPNSYGCKCPPEFYRPNPFGSLLGYQTNLGVIKVPTQPMYGHIWDQTTSSWVLHAELPQQRVPANPDGGQDHRSRRSRAPPRRRSRGTPGRRR